MAATADAMRSRGRKKHDTDLRSVDAARRARARRIAAEFANVTDSAGEFARGKSVGTSPAPLTVYVATTATTASIVEAGSAVSGGYNERFFI
jgi:hypothetical protein